MKSFLRSINSKLKKNITVIEDNGSKMYTSLIDMPSGDQMEYVIASINSCDEHEMTQEQYAVARCCLKKMMIQNAIGHQKD